MSIGNIWGVAHVTIYISLSNMALLGRTHVKLNFSLPMVGSQSDVIAPAGHMLTDAESHSRLVTRIVTDSSSEVRSESDSVVLSQRLKVQQLGNNA